LASKIAFFPGSGQFGVTQSLRIVGATVPDHGPEDARQLVGGSGHRRLCPELGFQPSEPISQFRLRPVEGLCRHAKSVRETVVDLAGMGGVSPPAGDPVVWTQPHPGGEVLGAGELINVGAHFAQEGKAGLDAHAFHGGQINSELLAELLAHRFIVRLVAFLAGYGCQSGSPIFQRVHPTCDLLIAIEHELLMEAPGFQRLAQGEKVFLAPVTSQGFRDFGLTLLATVVAQAGERLGVALSGDDGIEDRQARLSGDVGDGVVQLHIHLVERLLNPQQVLAAGAHHALAVAHQRTHRADRCRRTEGRVEQADAVQVLQPLATPAAGEAAG